MKIRINKYISEAGICSRRDADRKIEQGKVRVNGRPAELGDQVDDDDEVLVDGNPVQTRVQRVYIAYNKPLGVTSTTDHTDPDNIIKSVAYHGGRVFPVGRLDKDSEGLILLTNNGDIVNKVLRVSNAHEKEYTVTVDKPVTDEFVKKMSDGVPIIGVRTKKCKVTRIDQNSFTIVLQQGLNRQIRRMCKFFGYSVLRLVRVRIMHIQLDTLPVGSWRFLTDGEVAKLQEEVKDSANTKVPSGEKKKKAYTKAPGKFTPSTPEEPKSGRGTRGKAASDRRGGKPSGGPARGAKGSKPGGGSASKTTGKSGFSSKPGSKSGFSSKPGSKSGFASKPGSKTRSTTSGSKGKGNR